MLWRMKAVTLYSKGKDGEGGNNAVGNWIAD
jgi:hypothetical protein